MGKGGGGGERCAFVSVSACVVSVRACVFFLGAGGFFSAGFRICCTSLEQVIENARTQTLKTHAA